MSESRRHLVFNEVEALFPFGSVAFVELRQRLWVELLSRAVQERVGNTIFTIARDRTVDATFLQRLVEVLSDLGAEVHCIELACSDHELERRVVSEDRAVFGKVHTMERLRELRAAGAFPSFDMPMGTVTVDTSGLSVQQTVTLVDARINHGSRAA